MGTTCDAIAAIIGPFLTQLFVVGLNVPFMLAGAAAWIGAGMLVLVKLFCDESGTGPSAPSTPSAETAFDGEEFEEAVFEELESEARGLTQVAPNQGRPVFEAKALAKVLFPGMQAGIDYDEVYAQDITAYMSTLYSTWEQQGHLQVLGLRADVNRLDELKAQEASGKLSKEDYKKKRVDELRKQQIHNRVVTVHNELIKRSHPFLPDRGSWENPNKDFLQAIHDMLEDLGHDDWASSVPGFGDGSLGARTIIPH